MTKNEVAFVDKKTITLNRLATALLKEGFTVKLDGLQISYSKIASVSDKYHIYFRGQLDNRSETRRITMDNVKSICHEYETFVNNLRSIDRFLSIKEPDGNPTFD